MNQAHRTAQTNPCNPRAKSIRKVSIIQHVNFICHKGECEKLEHPRQSMFFLVIQWKLLSGCGLSMMPMLNENYLAMFVRCFSFTWDESPVQVDFLRHNNCCLCEKSSFSFTQSINMINTIFQNYLHTWLSNRFLATLVNSVPSPSVSDCKTNLFISKLWDFWDYNGTQWNRMKLESELQVDWD